MRIKVDIYWNGNAFDFEGNTEEPFESLHATWLQAHTQGLEVIAVKRTADGHKPRPFVPPVRDPAE